ncbi:MAG: histidine kinase [Lewinellaceae bacterium]|nr:histidine kinase [Lewinellaceae bacterium]
MKILPHKSTWLQVLFWGMLWALVPVLLSGNFDLSDWIVVRSAVVWLGIMVIVIANAAFLLPRLYFQKKQLWYILSGVALVAVVTFVVQWDIMPWSHYFNRPRSGGGRPGMSGMRIIGWATPFFTSFIGSALFEIAAYANKKEKEAIDSRSEKLEAELKFLKSQINPHFLFNALNNIYTLTLLKSEQAPEHLLKLSGMLRYMLYDCREDKVPLGKEVEYLRHFIDLHMLKDSRGLNVRVELDESQPQLRIAPMILIPFVENAFKHSKVEDLERGWIHIQLTTIENGVIFEVNNSRPEANFTKDQEGGIGLHNVRRHLELLYPLQHELRIETSEGQFAVYLKIQPL